MLCRVALVLLIGHVLAAVGCSNATHSERPDGRDARSTHDANSGVAEMHPLPLHTYTCRVVLFNLDPAMPIEFRLSDEALIKALVLDPISSAKRDTYPAYYEMLGCLTIESDGQVIEDIALFLPLGHIKRQDRFLIADFTKLRQHLLSFLKMEQECLQASANDVDPSERNADRPSEEDLHK